MADEARTTPSISARWALLRDLVVFQAKLLCDALRDLVMSPASLLATLLGLLTDPGRPDRHFRRLMHLGRRSERWINLFGGDERVQGSIDDLFDVLERRLREKHDEGGLTAQAKEAVDRAIDALHRLESERGGTRAGRAPDAEG